MVKYLKKMALKFFACVLILSAQMVFADVLIDPTKPPISMMDEDIRLQESVSSEPVLQSVTLGSEIKSAIISGESVLVGGYYKQFKLVALNTSQAVLKAKNGDKKTLRLDFSILKTPVNSNAIQPLANNKQATNKK
jgi:hypothetical protein